MREKEAFDEIWRRIDTEEFDRMWKYYLEKKEEIDKQGKAMLAAQEADDMKKVYCLYVPLTKDELLKIKSLLRCDMDILKNALIKLDINYQNLNDQSLPPKKRGAKKRAINNTINDKEKARGKIHEQYVKVEFNKMWEIYTDAKEEILEYDNEMVKVKMKTNGKTINIQFEYAQECFIKLTTIREKIGILYQRVVNDLKCDKHVLRDDLQNTHRQFISSLNLGTYFENFIETPLRDNYSD